MGLAVCIGALADLLENDPEGADWLRKDFEVVNRVLADHGLPAHVEPEIPPTLDDRSGLGSFPYSWLHYLRRAVAFARQAPGEFCPVKEGDNPADDERIDRELSVYLASHFICHSDCEGFYVPIDFPEPLYDDDRDELVGGVLGSSQRAMQELIQAAPLLSIPLPNGQLSDEVASAIAEEREGASPYWIERQVWLSMFEAFRLSIKTKCAVMFN
jgi:hypothetical protein